MYVAECKGSDCIWNLFLPAGISIITGESPKKELVEALVEPFKSYVKSLDAYRDYKEHVICLQGEVGYHCFKYKNRDEFWEEKESEE